MGREQSSGRWRAGRSPFLRLLPPLAAGIVAGDAFPQSIPLAAYAALMLLLSVSLLIGYRFRGWGFGVAVGLFMGCLGYGVTSRQAAATTFRFSDGEAVYKARIAEHPEEKKNSILCRAVLLCEVRTDSLASYPHDYLFSLYFPKDSAATLQRGDELLIHARLRPTANNGNPDEFDYVQYMEQKGYSGSAYVPDGHWKRIGHDPSRTLTQKAQDSRAKVINLYRQLNIRDDELAVLSALTVGEKSILSDEIKETYSTTGASHVLALSGLHVGLLYALLFSLLSPLWRQWKRLKPFLMFLIILLLGCFAFFTGLSPSVVRAVAMFTLLALASMLEEESVRLNVMAAAAFFMLLVKPLWLFDVGFQLSFTAILAFTYVQPKIYALWEVKNRLSDKLWMLFSASLAIQVCTAPWLLYYFSRFTFHFLLTNLWIIPSVTLILYSAIFLLLLTPIPLFQQLFAPLVKGVILLQNMLLRGIEHLPIASVEGVWIDGWGTLLMFLFILTVYHALTRRTVRHVRLSLWALLALFSWHSFSMIANAPRRSIAFYNVRGCSAVHCMTDGSRSWIAYADSAQDLSQLHRALAPHWNRLHLDAPALITGTYADAGIAMRDRIVTYGGKRICLLDDNRWRDMTAPHPLAIDYLYISKDYRGGIEELGRLFTIRTVVIDASLPRHRQERIAEECSRLGIACHNLGQKGALRIVL